MSLDYHKRTDFRAFDVLADAIQHATPAELDAAIASCADIARDHAWDMRSRLLFKGFANLMRLYLRRFNKPRKLWQQTVTEITRGL